jgi:heterodisulfide reductase subunit C
LHDLWQASKQRLKEDGFPPPHEWIREKTASEWAKGLDTRGEKTADHDKACLQPQQMDRIEAFAACVQCSICSGVCPVVEARDITTPKDLTPQQVMNLLRLGLKDLAMGSRMVWDCVTCYQCQEHCPQNIRIVDIFYELRNRACRTLPAVRFGKEG